MSEAVGLQHALPQQCQKHACLPYLVQCQMSEALPALDMQQKRSQYLRSRVNG
jgi:hypothetical protein